MGIDLDKIDLDQFELGTGTYSKGYELADLKIRILTANKLFEFFKEHYDGVDIVSKKKASERLGVSYATLDNWERLGLRRLQSPYESSKKVFYLWTDIIAFLTVR
ncbi:TPA: hypothetical protein U1Y72_001409 [Streptococcus suis]|uniref:hypothetical protein n=1 Tax=Streptococcus TaxID=1301 RepID=UPI001557B9C0|nr:hypothetical protein [Streptococcus suis]HEL1566407.1 hypothetical protein [Streptococcus suis]HEM4403088.1 hypothetical protein [Streptococcus suis]